MSDWPIQTKIVDYWGVLRDYTYGLLRHNKNSIPVQKEIVKVVTETKVVMFREGRNFVRLAGFSGALAVALAAYGSHAFRREETDKELIEVFQSGNKLHFFHTLALLGVPLTRHPKVVGTLLTTGMIIFSGSCYYHALTRQTTFRRFTPFGGMCLIAGWLAMIF